MGEFASGFGLGLVFALLGMGGTVLVLNHKINKLYRELAEVERQRDMERIRAEQAANSRIVSGSKRTMWS